MEHKNRAIILRVIDFGEADRIATFFTEDFGKIKGVAKNAKRSRKRFGGGLEPGTIGTVRYFEKQNVELVRLDELAVEQPVWKLSGSLDKLLALATALELADKMIPISHTSRERFALLSRWLNFLVTNEPNGGHRQAFFYKWLVASGIGPVFDGCTICNKDDSELWYLEGAHGGTVCGACHRVGRENLQISGDLLKYLRQFKLGKIPAEENKHADKVFEYLIKFAIGGELKSLSVMKSLI